VKERLGFRFCARLPERLAGGRRLDDTVTDEHGTALAEAAKRSGPSGADTELLDVSHPREKSPEGQVSLRLRR